MKELTTVLGFIDYLNALQVSQDAKKKRTKDPYEQSNYMYIINCLHREKAQIKEMYERPLSELKAGESTLINWARYQVYLEKRLSKEISLETQTKDPYTKWQYQESIKIYKQILEEYMQKFQRIGGS